MTSNQTPTFRWGIVGCGDVTEVKSGPAYQQTDGFELSSVMRRNLDKARDYAARHNVANYTDNAHELIHNPNIDAVYIATPPDSHLEYALQVAKANKPCCIEKPMAPSYEECLTITDTFREKNLPLFVAYYRRSLPRFQQVKAWLEQAAIGELRHVDWHYSRPPSETDLARDYTWRTDPNIATGGYFDDLASHGLDLIVYLLGAVKMVRGISTNQQGLYDAKDAVTACWLHENNVTGSGSWNFGSGTERDELTLYGSQGSMSFAVFTDAPIVLSNQAGSEKAMIANPATIQLPHVQNMYSHLTGGQLHPSTGATATHVAWVMDSILGKL